ncbi:MAG TPA: LLM class flavin-dependent oxidoreductase [Dehalococcoidia bacterium]|nr:LLM class flavin-dependent oxidoreductase [Dehalococcoidia bacterium]
MQAYYFTEMPYPHYPEEAAKKLNSQRVILPSEYCDPEIAADLYNRYLDEHEYADELGLNIMLNEHHQTPTCLDAAMPLSAAALIRRTKQAKILLLGNPIAHRDNPVRVAEEMSLLDCLSRGRLISGFVRGVPTEIHPANTNPVHTRERFEEAHDLIVKAWTERKPFNWEGRFWHYRYVNPWPRPYQQPHPPVWIPASSAESIPWIAKHQYVHASFLLTYEEQEKLHKIYQDTCAELGLPPAGADKFAHLALVYVAETDEKAREEGEALMWYIRQIRHPGFNNPPGYLPPPVVARFFMPQNRPSPPSWEELNDTGVVIWGNPQTVIEKIKYLHQRCQVGHLMMMMQAGFVSTELTRKSLKLFAQEVYPAIRELGESETKQPAGRAGGAASS